MRTAIVTIFAALLSLGCAGCGHTLGRSRALKSQRDAVDVRFLNTMITGEWSLQELQAIALTLQTNAMCDRDVISIAKQSSASEFNCVAFTRGCVYYFKTTTDGTLVLERKAYYSP